jgi:hypothetical protein
MKGQSGKNQGVRMIAQFDDRAIYFVEGEPLKSNEEEKRSKNGGAESTDKQTPPETE